MGDREKRRRVVKMWFLREGRIGKRYPSIGSFLHDSIV